MKRDEKNEQTHQKIMDSALLEFSQKSYGEASLNTVCTAGGLSKGIIYHYFADKDALYLACVRDCFDALTAYLGDAVAVEVVPIEQGLAAYFAARTTFFAAHPQYLGVFCSAVMNPPDHLAADIDRLAAALNEQTVSILTALLGTVRLRADVTREEVVEVFREYQDFVNTRFQGRTLGETTLREHERRCHRSLQILLYGVVEREA